MLYMESRKSFEVGGMKKINSLPSVKKYSSNYHLCRVPKIIYSVNKSLPSVKKHSTNTYLYQVPKIIHSTKNYLPSVFILPSVFCMTLGKDLICRCSKKTLGKDSALDKDWVSRSAVMPSSAPNNAFLAWAP